MQQSPKNGENINDWGKYEYKSPQKLPGQNNSVNIHFYYNPKTGQVNYNIDYKVKNGNVQFNPISMRPYPSELLKPPSPPPGLIQ